MSGSSWGFCLAIYDFVGLILGHFGPMFGPTTYSVSWRAICWAYLGPSGHIGSFQGYVGPIGILGHLEGYVEILEGYKAISGYFEPSVLELERSFWHQHKDLKEDVRWRDTFFYILRSWRAMLGLSKTIFPAWELNFWIFGAMLHAAFGMCDAQKTL